MLAYVHEFTSMHHHAVVSTRRVSYFPDFPSVPPRAAPMDAPRAGRPRSNSSAGCSLLQGVPLSTIGRALLERLPMATSAQTALLHEIESALKARRREIETPLAPRIRAAPAAPSAGGAGAAQPPPPTTTATRARDDDDATAAAAAAKSRRGAGAVVSFSSNSSVVAVVARAPAAPTSSLPLGPHGFKTTIAGCAKAAQGFVDGPALAARFAFPNACVEGSGPATTAGGGGALYIVDTDNHRVRVLRGGRVSTLAGGCARRSSADGVGQRAVTSSCLKRPDSRDTSPRHLQARQLRGRRR